MSGKNTDTALPVLGFARPLFQHGENLSVRRGSRWHGTPHVRLQLADGQLSAPVALRTDCLRFDQLCDADLAAEHDPACRTVAGLLAVMQQHYPGFEAQETVTLCHFNLP